MAKGIQLPILSKFDPRGIKEAESNFGTFGKTVAKLGGIIAAAFSVRAIVDFGKESIAMAEEVAKSNDRINAIADSMGVFGDQAEVVSQRLIDLADAQEINLGVDDSIIKSTQAKLLTFKNLAGSADEVGGSFDRATAAAIDLAAAGFGSAEGNATQLGKALQDPIKGIAALTRVGVTFTDAEKEKIKTLVESGKTLEAQDMILKALEQQVGGTAAATATASEKMKIAFDNIKETVGAALLPAFQNLALAMLPIIEKIGPQIATVVTALVPVFDKLAVIIPLLIDALMPLVPVIVEIISLFADLAIAVMPIVIDLLEMLVPVIAAILPVLTQFLKDLITPLVPIMRELILAFKPLIDLVLPLITRLLEKLLPVFLKLLQAVIIPLLPLIVTMIDNFMPLLETVLPVLVDLLEMFVIPTLLLLAEILKVVLPIALGVVVGAMKGFGGFMDNLATKFKDVWNGIVKFFKSVINSMLGFYEGFINGFIDIINTGIQAINRIEVDVPQWLTDLTGIKDFKFNLSTLGRVNLPRLAEGGIVMPQPGGVLAQIAEAGKPEAVIPLDKLEKMGGNGGNTYNITVNAGVGTDGRSVGELIVNEITRFERSNGLVFARA